MSKHNPMAGILAKAEHYQRIIPDKRHAKRSRAQRRKDAESETGDG